MNADSVRRQELIDGLRDLTAYLETHPEVPVDGWAELTFCVLKQDDAAGIAATADITHTLGVGMTDSHERPITDETSHFSAIRRFGPAVSYKATYILRTDMDDYVALMSYRDSVKADKTR